MLDLSDTTKLSERVWEELSSRTELPESVQAAMRKDTVDLGRANCKRQYARHPFHKHVIIIDGENHHACITKDLSRKGLGLYSPVNFLPRKVIRLWLPSGEILLVRVTRSRRISERCYEVGSSFCASQ